MSSSWTGIMDADHQGLVLMLLREGSLQHAIEVYREESGTTHDEARRAIRELAAAHGISMPGNRYLPLLLAAAIVLAASLLAVQAW